jgi:hypothetical protein
MKAAAAVMPALCVGLAICAASTAMREWTTQGILLAMHGPMDDRLQVLADHADDPPEALGDRATAGLAELALMAAAQGASPGERSLAKARAAQQIERLTRLRPDWATTQILIAQLDLLEHPSASSDGLKAYAASYRLAPFRMQEARWRIAYGAALWPRMRNDTRQQMLNEAEWLSRFDDDQRGSIEKLLGDSPAGMAYQYRMTGGAMLRP